MAGLDINEILSSRMTAPAAPEEILPSYDKQMEVERATASKVAGLESRVARYQAKVAQNSKSLVGRLGLDPNSFLGQEANDDASLVAGTARVAGQLAALPSSTAAQSQLEGLEEADFQAYNRLKQNAATPEDAERLNARYTTGYAPDAVDGEAPSVKMRVDGNKAVPTVLQRFESALKSRANARAITNATDLSGWVHSGNRDALAESIGSGFQSNWDQVKSGAAAFTGEDKAKGDGAVNAAGDVVSGLAGLLFNAGKAVGTNPSAVAEYALENLPQIGVGVLGAPGRLAMTASNVGYAADNYQKGIEKYQKENGGAYPPEAQRQEMAMWAASTALAEQVGDVSMLRGLGGVASETADSARVGFLASMRNAAGATVKGAVSEGATEGFQTFAEGEASLTPASAQDIYTGAVIGAAVGGTFQGTIAATTESKGAPRAEKDPKAPSAEETASFQKAVEANDPSQYLNEKAPRDYNPEKAVGVLFGNAQLDTATPETKKANLEKATEIVSSLESKIKQAKAIADELTPEALDRTRSAIAEREAALKTADEASAPAIQENITELKSILEEEIEVSKTLPKRLERIERMEAQLAGTKKVLTQLDEMVNPQQEVDVNTEIESVKQATDPVVAQQSADRIINLSMKNADDLSIEQATELASNESLTEPQRAYLRQFTEARISANAVKQMSTVAQEVLYGDKKNAQMGIETYRTEIADALRKGNQKEADRLITGLEKFATSHQGKAAVVQQAYEQARKQGRKPVQVINVGGEWQINTGKALNQKELTENGGLNVHQGSSKLLREVPAEAKALTDALAEQRAAIALKTVATPTVQPIASTPAVSSQQAAPTAPVEAPVVPTSRVSNEQAFRLSDAGLNDRIGKLQDKVADKTATPEDRATLSTLDKEMTRREDVAIAEARAESEKEVKSKMSTEEVTSIESGILDVLAQEDDTSKPYKEANLITRFLTQAGESASDASSRALVAVKDLMTSLRTGKVKATEFLDPSTLVDGKLNERQTDLIQDFNRKVKTWVPKIVADLVRKKESHFHYQDPLQFLMVDNEDGSVTLPENVLTAMAYAGYSYIIENASKTSNSPEDINAILQRDESTNISEAEYSLLAKVGLQDTVVMNSLGQKAIQALGLKAKKNAPRDLMPRLEGAVGARILKMLMDEGLVERTTIEGSVMGQLMEVGINEIVSFQFIRPVRDTEGALPEATQAILDKAKNTGNVLDKMFKVEPGLKEPSLKPIKYSQKSPRNTNQGIPKRLAKAIQKANNQAYYIRQDMLQLIGLLDPRNVETIAGATDIGTKQAANKVGAQAKNDGLSREYSRFRDFVDSMKDQKAPLYFEHTAWKQQRVGIATNMVNPQTSKLHRHMLFKQSWETKIDMNNDAQMDNFVIRVGEGLGVKADKQGNEKSLADAYTKLQDPKILAAVEMLRKVIASETGTHTQGQALSQADQQVIVDGVKAGGENMHTLDALVAWAAFTQAGLDGDTIFTTRLMGEVDGVTNGPMLSHLLMGAAESAEELFKLLNRGGMYAQGTGESNYNLWRAKNGNLDLYEVTTLHMTDEIATLYKDSAQDQAMLKVIYSFTGELKDTNGKVSKAGRNIIKTPLTAMVFGSSVAGAINSMADKFVESVNGAIEDLASGKSKISREQLIANINRLLSGTQKLDKDLSISDLMEGTFTRRQIEAIKESFTGSLGIAVENVMKRDFEQYIAARKQFNEAAQFTFELYNAAYTAMRDAKIAELIASGEIQTRKIQVPVLKDGKPVYKTSISRAKKKYTEQVTESKLVAIHDLSSEQEAEIREQLKSIAPVMKTAMSDDISNGIYMSKSGTQLSDNGVYAGDVEFATPFNDKDVKRTRTRGYERIESNPGVAMLPMQTHSLDSAASHEALMMSDSKGVEVLNVHDAHGTGVDGFQTAAQSLNESVWNVLLEHSPPSEAVNSLARVVQGLASMIEAGTLPSNAVDNIAKALIALAEKKSTKGNMISPFIVLDLVVRQTKAMADQANKIKYLTMMQMGVMDQYALEGGQYEITDADRAKAKAKLDALQEGVDEQLGDAIQWLNIDLKKALIAQIKEPIKVVKKPIEEDSTPDAKTLTTWGREGTPAVQSDPTLVAWFKGGKAVPAKQVIVQLRELLSKMPSNNTRSIQIRLLGVLQKVIDSDLVVKMVTPSTPVEDVLAKGGNTARAWYVSKGEEEAIYVLSPEFAQSGLTVETLTHELVHGALARVVQDELDKKKNDPSYTSEGLELIEELQELQAKAEQYIIDKKLNQHIPAVENIHEFMTWGMTNLAFQKEVLNKIEMKSKTTGNALVDGMKKFIQTITNLLFKGSTKTVEEQAVNGMTVLISNVSGLFAVAADNNPMVDMTLNQSNTIAQDYSTLDIYDALNTQPLDTEFDTHLRELLGGIVEKLHGAFGTFKKDLMQNQALSPTDVFLKALDTGVAPFASKALVSGFPFTEQEAYVLEQVEATVRAALDGAPTTTFAGYRELEKLYKETKDRLKVSDMDPDPVRAQELYDFVFKMEAGPNGRLDYLSRFAALGLANQQFNKLLQAPTAKAQPQANRSLMQRLQDWFEEALEWFSGKLTNTTPGQDADKKLTALVDQLVQIEAKKRAKIIRGQQDTYITRAEEGIAKVSEATRAQVSKFLSSPMLKNNRSKIVQGAAALANVVAKDQVDMFMEGLQRLRDNTFNRKQGIAASLISELKGHDVAFQALNREAKKNERERKAVIAETSKFVLQGFANKGKGMTRDAKSAISKVFLRTNLGALLNHGVDMDQVTKVVTDSKELDSMIAGLEAQLGENRYRHFYMKSAKALAYFRVESRATTAHLLMNAGNIARLYGTPYTGRVTPQEVETAQPIIDQLIALYALKYAPAKEMADARQVLQTEAARTDGNGVEQALRLHQELLRDSQARLFDGSEALMQAGYTPEIYNPYIQVEVATLTEGKELIKQGYVQESEAIPKDPFDPNGEEKYIFTLKDGGLRPWLSGNLSYTSKALKGADTNINVKKMAIAKQAAIRAMFNADPNFNPANISRNFTVPVVNSEGEVVNQRYMMKDKTKDAILERDNRFDTLLGVMAGSIYDKESSEEQNSKVIAALKEDFDSKYAERSASFVEVSAKSSDPELREIYRMLPDETKKAIKRIWGKDAMQVRVDLLDINFGYRKLSLSSIFDKEKEDRNAVEDLFTSMVEGMLYLNARRQGMPAHKAIDSKELAAVKVRRAEDMWQAFVREAKDIIVVKTGLVLLGNQLSNMTLLKMSGVSVKDIIYHHRVALKGALAYQEDTAELRRLEMYVASGYTQGNEEEYKREIVRLKDAIARNPVMPLIEGGLMPTIVEDLAADEDIYSYKSRFVRKTEKFTSKFNPAVVTVAKNVLMTHDTKIYKALSHGTQLSDFVARYTLYQHLITRKKNPLDSSAAIQKASDAFINYDIPMHRGIQFMDDMGVTMFTKYFLRVQRVIFSLSRENPAQVMGMMLMNHYFDLLPTIMDSSFIGKIGNNPLRLGAFEFPAAMDDLMTVNAGLSLFK